MADNDDAVDNDTNDDKNDLKDLRKAADEGRKALREAEAVRRELMFVKAGVNTDSKLGQLMLRSYEGELTADAIRAEAVELGAIRPDGEPTPQAPVIADDERAQGRVRDDLASGAGTPAVDEENPYDKAVKAHDAARTNGAPKERAMGEAFREVLEAAARGDKRVLL